MIDFQSFDALTFDCYGTLIDWETGLTRALDVLLADAEEVASGDELLELFGRFEAAAEHGAFKSYREVLTEVARSFAAEFALDLPEGAARTFASSVGMWPPFPDTVEALQTLSEHYQLCIVSNVDDDLFEGSAKQLQTSFSQVVTAQQVRSYKPRPEHFHEVLRRLALPMDRVLHVAQSLHHDVAPARDLGFSCVWVNRRSGRAGGGATPASSASPDLEVPDLAALVGAMGLD
jgi:2-haloacid dehalogenase